MLNITRRPGEAVRVGEDIEITVVEIKGNQVRFAISAPPEVNIRRSELPPRPVAPDRHEER